MDLLIKKVVIKDLMMKEVEVVIFFKKLVKKWDS